MARAPLLRRGVWLEGATVGWNLAEGVIAVMGKWLVQCHIPHHTTNNNTERLGGGGLTMVIDVR